MIKKREILYNEHFHNYIQEDLQSSGKLNWLLVSLSAQNVKFQFDRYNFYEAICNLHYIDEICDEFGLPSVVGEPYDTVRLLDCQYHYEVEKTEYPALRKNLKSALKRSCIKIHMIGRTENRQLFGVVDLFSPGITYKAFFELSETEVSKVFVVDLVPWVREGCSERQLIKMVEERIEKEETEEKLKSIYEKLSPLDRIFL